MKIGVDAACWTNKRGFGRFTRELLNALLEIDRKNKYVFFIDSETAASAELPDAVEKVVVQTTVAASKAAAADNRRSLRDLWAMTRAVWQRELDIFFFPTVYSYFPIFNRRIKTFVTIHDVIADSHPQLIFPTLKGKIFWKLKQNFAVRQADSILTVSEFSKQRIAEHFGLPASRLRVVCEAARPVFKPFAPETKSPEVLAQYGLKPDENFLLAVGGISPHKNLSALVEAFDGVRLGAGAGDLKLVLVGDYQDDPFFSAYPALKKRIRELGIENRVIFTGFVSDEDLVCLYNQARLLVFPSFEEGFGLPAIEAMACGTPVAASRSGALPEVLGTAGRYFDARNIEEMTRVIESVLNDADARKMMREIGLQRAESFRWSTAAEQTLTCFQEIMRLKQFEEVFRLKGTVNSKFF